MIVFYDEHGGFFDHVAPPGAPDDNPKVFGRYGVRVPALIVSPWIEPGSVSHTLFDHTSIIKTILLRFCPDALDAAGGQGAGKRLAHASDLGELLTRTRPRPAPDRYTLIRDAAARAATKAQGTPIDKKGLAGAPETDLQIRLAAATRELRRLGHPHDRP